MILHVPCSFVVYAATSLPPHGLILTGRHFYWSAMLDISHYKASKSKAPFASSLGGKKSVLCFSSIMQNKAKQNKLLAVKECPPLFFFSYCRRDQALLVVHHKVWGEMETSSTEGTLRGHVARCTLRSHHPSMGESQMEAVSVLTEARLGERLM